MGAFGAALIARERYVECEGTTMLSIEDIEAMEYSTTMTKCKGCTNNCRLTINHFSGGRKFITGNRCERGLGKAKSENKLPNLFEYKLKRYFDYEPLPEGSAKRGVNRNPPCIKYIRKLSVLVHIFQSAWILCQTLSCFYKKHL